MDLQYIHPHTKDLGGGFMVRRSLPSAPRQAVGPFLFFDHFGPITATPADNHDVRPHPHIGLATVTYLFEGSQMHRDSTGVVQRIEPGAINWMTAGRGIVHSERTPEDLRGVERRSHGLQLWSALPIENEEDEPSFEHTPASALLSQDLGQGVVARVMIGEAFGTRSPVKTLSPTLYIDFQLSPGATLVLPAAAPERALYGVDNGFVLDGTSVPSTTMIPIPAGATPTLSAPGGARLVMVGGEPLGHRFMSWNFVSSSKERIQQAAEDWQAQAFPKVPGETEFIPLPPKRV